VACAPGKVAGRVAFARGKVAETLVCWLHRNTSVLLRAWMASAGGRVGGAGHAKNIICLYKAFPDHAVLGRGLSSSERSVAFKVLSRLNIACNERHSQVT